MTTVLPFPPEQTAACCADCDKRRRSTGERLAWHEEDWARRDRRHSWMAATVLLIIGCAVVVALIEVAS